MNDPVQSSQPLLESGQPWHTSIGIRLPIIGGAMYPCSNPELVAAVSQAGGIGIVQPITLTYVFNYDFLDGLRYMQRLTQQPIGMNVLIESSSRRYREKMERWLHIALEQNIRFFITSLGKPDWVVKIAHRENAVVFHDVTERKWAQKGIDAGVDGLIAVNSSAGGHAGPQTADQLYRELQGFGVPIICAGGIADAQTYAHALGIGYAGVQIGTGLIATHECSASDDYKQAILAANVDDIVLSERITGVPVSVINTPYIEALGLRARRWEKWFLGHKKTKHLMRWYYVMGSMLRLKSVVNNRVHAKQIWQAGKSAGAIQKIQHVNAFVHALTQNGSVETLN